MNFPRVKVYTYGCASNQADSQIMVNLLTNSVVFSDNPEYIIINTCSVKGKTENKIIDFIKTLDLPKRNIIICGCLVSDKKKREEFKEYSLISPYNVTRTKEVIEFLECNKTPIHFLDYSKTNKLKDCCFGGNISIVPILIGCLGNCTYCKTKQAKPLFYSYPLEDIVNKVKELIKQGSYEIWLSSEDNGAYGKDLGLTYLNLLNTLEKEFSGKVMFRFGMANPDHIYEHLEDTKKFFKNTKSFFKFLHIPIQSANDLVLKEMNRKYHQKEIEKIFKELNNVVTISTDIICGFPNEAEDQFQESYDFIEKHKPLIVNISQFWPRPYTKAQTMEQLTTEVKKSRSKKFTSLQKTIIKENLVGFIGKDVELYIDEIRGQFLWGRTRSYILTKITSNQKLKLGKWHTLKIKAVENNHLLV